MNKPSQEQLDAMQELSDSMQELFYNESFKWDNMELGADEEHVKVSDPQPNILPFADRMALLEKALSKETPESLLEKLNGFSPEDSESQEEINDGYQLEGLDRTHTLLVMVEQLLGHVSYNEHIDKFDDFDSEVHPSIWSDRCKYNLAKINYHLADLYQAIGEWTEEDSIQQGEE